MQILLDYSVFLLKVLTLGLVTLTVIWLASRIKGAIPDTPPIKVSSLNERHAFDSLAISANTLSGKALKKTLKHTRKALKSQHEADTPSLFVVPFNGDIKASDVTQLRRIVSALINTAKPGDEVCLVLESAGGMVAHYGLASAQLARLKKHDIKLSVCIDKIAASGGYMMASVADRIIAAPFAMVGSIGVIAQLPNFNRWLKAQNIDYEQHMGGTYKRTLTLFGENTEMGRERFKHDIQHTHELFKAHLKTHRPALELDTVATGEVWYGQDAINHQLVDEIMTSDEYIDEAIQSKSVYQISIKKPTGPKALLSKASTHLQQLMTSAIH